jgi:hypothetical protein
MEVLPDMHTEDASMLISDSGITRTRIEAKVWYVYSRSEEPYWHFSQGFYLERFDSLFNVEFSIRADTVYNYQKTSIWRAINNVLVISSEGNSLETSELFFDQKAKPGSREAIYTDKFVRITEGNRLYTGYGLKSNTSLSDWVIYQSGGEFEFEENVPQTTDTTETLHATSLLPE